jgi:hypothetical protein
MIAGNTLPAATDVAPPVAAATAASQSPRRPLAADTAPPLLAHLLKMADGYLDQKKELRIVNCELRIGGWTVCPFNPQFAILNPQSFFIAERHEKNGKGHLARSIYERLL